MDKAFAILSLSIISITLIGATFFEVRLYRTTQLFLSPSEKCENWNDFRECCKTYKTVKFCFQYHPPYLSTYCNKTQKVPDLEQSINLQIESPESFWRNCSLLYFKARYSPREDKVELIIEDRSKKTFCLVTTELTKDIINQKWQFCIGAFSR